jgi:hypothetical protein
MGERYRKRASRFPANIKRCLGAKVRAVSAAISLRPEGGWRERLIAGCRHWCRTRRLRMRRVRAARRIGAPRRAIANK